MVVGQRVQPLLNPVSQIWTRSGTAEWQKMPSRLKLLSQAQFENWSKDTLELEKKNSSPERWTEMEGEHIFKCGPCGFGVKCE